MTSTRHCRRRSYEGSRDDEATARHSCVPLVHHRRPEAPSHFPGGQPGPGNEVYLSVASVWETIIKYNLGKLPLPAPPADYLPRQRDAHGIASLPIDEGAMSHLAGLPLLHRDPFDRLLVAQALQHGLTLATVDPEIAAYSLPLLPTA